MRKSKQTLAFGLILAILFMAGIGHAAENTGNIEGKAKVRRARTSEDVLVFLEKVGDNKFDPPKEHSIMDQKSLVFTPHVLPILKGTTVDFTNNDSVKHNIFSPDKVADKFNLGTYGKGMVRTKVFNKVGEVTLLCNVHTEMEGYIMIFSNPYFAKTDKKGNFKIENIPPGEYTLKTWHKKKKSVSQEVTVEAGQTTAVDLTLKKRR